MKVCISGFYFQQSDILGVKLSLAGKTELVGVDLWLLSGNDESNVNEFHSTHDVQEAYKNYRPTWMAARPASSMGK